MKIAMVIDYYSPAIGGAELQLASLTPYLKMAGMDVRVITRRLAGLAPFELINGVPVYRMPSHRSPKIATFMFQAFSIFHLARFKPDVIHAHGSYSAALIGIAAKRLTQTRLVVKILSGQEITLLHSKFLGGQRWKKILKHTDAFITISQQIDDSLIQAKVEDRRRWMIPNGVDLRRFRPIAQEEKKALRRQLGLPEDRLVVVYSGRLHHVKGADVLIKAWQRCPNRPQETQLVMLGTGPMEKELRELAGENVTFKGAIFDVSPYLQAADIFVLPSQWEGLSNALLEAMACGLPVIASDCQGNKELIRQDETGFLFPVGDEAQLSRVLTHLMDHLEDGQRPGQNARRWVEENRPLESTINGLLELYASLTGKAAAH